MKTTVKSDDGPGKSASVFPGAIVRFLRRALRAGPAAENRHQEPEGSILAGFLSRLFLRLILFPEHFLRSFPVIRRRGFPGLRGVQFIQGLAHQFPVLPAQ